jgi:hypothetical protein
MTDAAPFIPAVVRGTASLDEMAAIAASMRRSDLGETMTTLAAWRRSRRAAIDASMGPLRRR